MQSIFFVCLLLLFNPKAEFFCCFIQVVHSAALVTPPGVRTDISRALSHTGAG